MKLGKDGDGDKVTALEKAVTNLVNFIESGGEVDFIVPEEDEKGSEEDSQNGPDYKDLRLTFQEIRQIESKLKLIESKST